ncbi:MAG: nucleoside triphosphate pyrophosphohydrolase family protein [Candidatus Dehalobacter alkaniphilus]
MKQISKEEQIEYIRDHMVYNLNQQSVITGKNANKLIDEYQHKIDVLGELYVSVSNNDLNEFQIKSLRTANKLTPEQMVLNGVLGLNGEAGEIADLYKKATFQGHELDEDKLIEEAGDVIWYVAILASGLGVSLSEVAHRNVLKLQKRYPNGFDSERSKNRESEIK